MEKTKEIKLNDNKTITMRVPTVGDMRAVAHCKSDEEKELTMVCNLTNMTSDELDKMSLSDYKKLQKALQDFLE